VDYEWVEVEGQPGREELSTRWGTAYIKPYRAGGFLAGIESNLLPKVRATADEAKADVEAWIERRS
jgi:hypothetical protein